MGRGLGEEPIKNRIVIVIHVPGLNLENTYRNMIYHFFQVQWGSDYFTTSILMVSKRFPHIILHV